MPLDAVKNDQALLVGPFQQMSINRAIVHPNRQLGRREVVLYLDVKFQGFRVSL
jgi:hypothetical protein